MSASRFSPGATEAATAALRPVVLGSGEDDMVAAAHIEEREDDPTTGEPNGQLSLAPPHPTPGPDPIPLEEHAPLDDTQAAIDRQTFDDLQPMLDLRFPEVAQPMVHLVSDTDVDNRDETLEAARIGVTNLLDTGLEREVIASFVEMPSGGPAAPIDARVETPPILHALDPADLQAGTVDDPAHDTEASTRDIGTTAEVADASEVARHELEFPEEADDHFSRIADANDSALPYPVPVEDDPTTLRIAAEADATAQALENLKRLLAHKLPDLAIEAATSRPPDANPVQPPPIQVVASTPLDAADFAHQHDGIEDFQLPPIRGEMHGRRAGFALGSFLSGFAASWIFGAVLYAYLIFG